LPGGKKEFRDFQSDRTIFSMNMIYPGQNVSRCAQTVQEPCMTHCMPHRENLVAKDMSDEFSNVRSLTRYEIFHPYVSFSSYSILCPSLIEYRVMANCRAGDCYRRTRRLPRATNGLGSVCVCVTDT